MTDGTAGGTYMLKDINRGNLSSNIRNIYEYEDRLYFAASTDDDGDKEIWTSDGTSFITGTSSIYQSSFGGYALGGVKDYLITRYDDVRKHNLNSDVDEVLFDMSVDYTDSGVATDQRPLSAGNALYFFMYATPKSGQPKGVELWKADPFANEFKLVKDINSGSRISPNRRCNCRRFNGR